MVEKKSSGLDLKATEAFAKKLAEDKAKKAEKPAKKTEVDHGPSNRIIAAAVAKNPEMVAKKSVAKVETVASRSKSISESWNNPEVAAKRAQRNSVKVGKEVYRSVLEAFKKLQLPVSQHIKFRMALKAAKTAEFKLGDQVFTFSLVD